MEDDLRDWEGFGGAGEGWKLLMEKYGPYSVLC